ncbi:hypothetical protein O3P69_016991 [Scylla paramamosain]|uniref:Uncharacterized protein n=1 Tax=Scylla paramamosain TaxID=85552 RepID=A0AAW0TUK6_SCYPA
MWIGPKLAISSCSGPILGFSRETIPRRQENHQERMKMKRAARVEAAWCGWRGCGSPSCGWWGRGSSWRLGRGVWSSLVATLDNYLSQHVSYGFQEDMPVGLSITTKHEVSAVPLKSMGKSSDERGLQQGRQGR